MLCRFRVNLWSKVLLQDTDVVFFQKLAKSEQEDVVRMDLFPPFKKRWFSKEPNVVNAIFPEQIVCRLEIISSPREHLAWWPKLRRPSALSVSDLFFWPFSWSEVICSFLVFLSWPVFDLITLKTLPSRKMNMSPYFSSSCCWYCFDATLAPVSISLNHLPNCTNTALHNSSEALPLHRSLASTFFNQLVQTKQSPRNANSAVTQVWGNLKPVGNVRLVGGNSFGKTHPGCLDRWGKGESWQMQPILGKRLSRSVFKISQKR